jgi:CPA1 family monovalent cation:H+ antiporter
LDRIDTSDQAVSEFILPVGVIVGVVLVSRFLWLFGSDVLWMLASRLGFKVRIWPDFSVTVILGWAGIRGPVTLAAALALPEDFPGRDVILVSAFGVIFVTILIQGPTLPLLVKFLRSTGSQSSERLARDEATARMRLSQAQLRAFSATISAEASKEELCLLEYYRNRADREASALTETAGSRAAMPPSVAILAAIKAGRAELLEMYRTGEISDRALVKLEQDLDAQEFGLEQR